MALNGKEILNIAWSKLTSIPSTLTSYIVNAILDRNTFVEDALTIGKKVAIANEEYGDTGFVGTDVSANNYNYKSIRYRKGARAGTTNGNSILYHAITYTPFVESTAGGRVFENSVDIKRGVHVGNLQVFSSIQRAQNGLTTPAGAERGTVDYVAQYEAYGCNFGATENVGFRSKLVQNLNNTIIRVSRDNTLAIPLATITTAVAHGYLVGDTVQINEPALGFPKPSANSISWERFNNVVTVNVASHTFAIDDTVTLNFPSNVTLVGLVTAVSATSVSFVNHGANVSLTNVVYTLAHRPWVVITAVLTTTTFRFVNPGSFIAPNTVVSGGTTTAPTTWNHRSSGSAPNAFIGKMYLGTATRTVNNNILELTSSLKAGSNPIDTAIQSGLGTLRTNGLNAEWSDGVNYNRIERETNITDKTGVFNISVDNYILKLTGTGQGFLPNTAGLVGKTFIIHTNNNSLQLNIELFSTDTIDGQSAINSVGYKEIVVRCIGLGAWATNLNGNEVAVYPKFHAFKNNTQSIPTDIQTLIQFNEKDYDIESCFSTSTYRFTPNKSGYYHLSAGVRIDGGVGTGERMISVWKNNTEYKRAFNSGGAFVDGTGSWYQMSIDCDASANGTTDYFEVKVQHGAGANRLTTAGLAFTYFQGHKLP